MVKVYSAHRRQAWHRIQGVGWLAGALLLALAGCDASTPNGAVDLYHGLEGGPIADQRPPPPGADQPYPNVGTIPARPLASDVAAQQRISDSLAAQRDFAQAAAAKDPLTALPPQQAAPKPAPPPDPNANKVVVDAASAPPLPPAPVPAPQPATPAAKAPAGAMPSSIDTMPPLPAAVASGPLPVFADAPPPPPVGFETVVPLPPPDKPIVAAPPAALPNGVRVDFTPGSSVLPPSATLRLRRFALAHPGTPFAVTGRGDGVLPNGDAQSRAIDLALKRAGAIAASLGSAGVAPGNLHLRAEALGNGSAATLLN
jgi:hypothetical protein